MSKPGWYPRPSPVRDRILSILRQEGSLITAELAARMGKTATSMAMVLSRANQYGWVHKIPCKATDRRWGHELNRWELPHA